MRSANGPLGAGGTDQIRALRRLVGEFFHGSRQKSAERERYFTSLQANLPECVGTYLRPCNNQWNGPPLGASQFRPP